MFLVDFAIVIITGLFASIYINLLYITATIIEMASNIFQYFDDPAIAKSITELLEKMIPIDRFCKKSLPTY